MSVSRAWQFRRLPWVVLSCAMGFVGCDSCGDGRFVAELLAADKAVDRDFARAVNTWSKAAPGDRFEMGDGVRTGPVATATLGLARRGRLFVKSDTIMRFSRSLEQGAPARGLELQQGEVTVETGDLEVGVRTARGLVRLSTGSAVQVRAEQGKVRFDVMVGHAEFAGAEKPLIAKAGAGFEVDVLAPSVEQASPAAHDAAGGPAPPSAALAREPGRPAGPGGELLQDLPFRDPPAGVTVTMPAGESGTIHDPAPPTDLLMTVARCPALAVLEFDQGNGRFDAFRSRGEGELRVSIARGSYRYRVRCVRNGRVELPPVSVGRISVTRDAATRPLPVNPVAITADADGRRYTVSYQNRLPVITLRWPEPPRAEDYVLQVQPEHDAAFSVHGKQASMTLAAGRLGEGLHRFWFEGAGKHSEQGLLRVSFDYKTPTAYLTSPVDGLNVEAGPVRFAGGSLVGSVVRVAEAAMKLDAQGRFATQVEVPTGVAGLAVRVQHPSTGIHYYVRHLSLATAR